MSRRSLYSNNPLGDLLIVSIHLSNLDLGDFIHSLDYQNVNKGVRHLYAALNFGEFRSDFLNRFVRVGYFTEQQLREAQELNLSHYEQKAKQSLRQSPKLIAERYSSSDEPKLPSLNCICIFGLAGGNGRRTISLPENINEFSIDDRLVLIKASIQSHFNLNAGNILKLFPIRSYLYVDGDRVQRYSILGDLVEYDANLRDSFITLRI